MKISNMLKSGKITLSFEVFPPKDSTKFESVASACKSIAKLGPDFMSVTYGAGGGTSHYTSEIARLLSEEGVPSVAHLTCINSSLEHIDAVLDTLEDKGIENVLALRGDLLPDAPERAFGYAYELVEHIKKRKPEICIGAACYPEGHIEAESREKDMVYLKQKVDSGVDFLTTQMFFDNDVLYGFLYRALKAGINVPIIPGIMPIMNAKQIKRSCEMSGSQLPPKLKVIIDKYEDKPEALKEAGIIYACDQIINLIANGIQAVHIYTMNKPEVAKAFVKNLSGILER